MTLLIVKKWIEAPKEKIRYDIIDSHLHYTDFLEKSDGFPALCEAMDMAGVSKSIIFGMGIAKQWDNSMPEAPSYYLSNDSRCYYYSGTDFLLAEDLLAQPEEIRRFRALFAVGLILFIIGILFCYFAVYTLALDFFLVAGENVATPLLRWINI